jgi:hypothetical protein
MRQLTRTLVILIAANLCLANDLQTIDLNDTNTINTVVIHLDGVIILKNSPAEHIQIITSTEVNGDIMGISNQEDIPKYQIRTSIKDSTLTISPLPRAKTWSIGINTRTERHTHTIYLPAGKNVEIASGESELTVEGLFTLLRIKNREGDVTLRVNDENLKYLRCVSPNGKVHLNREALDDELYVMGFGNSVIDITCNRGDIFLRGKLLSAAS